MSHRDQGIAWALIIAVVAVVLYPWTLMLPAPHLQLNAYVALFAAALVARVSLLISSQFNSRIYAQSAFQFSLTSQNLALICTLNC